MGCSGSTTSGMAPAKGHPDSKVNKVVWFFGYPTAGKSWSADFCAVHHDWIHVDGDEELMRSNPKTHAIWNKIHSCYEDYLQKDKVPPRETYGPFLGDLVRKVKEARAANPDKTVAVAFALYSKSMRDYIRET